MRHPLASIFLSSLIGAAVAGDTDWPEADADCRPWLRWHWPADLSCPEDPGMELDSIAKLGFGGVEIVPLGAETDSLWPGPGWAPRIAETAKACKTLNLNFDLSVHPGKRPPAWVEGDPSIEWLPFSATVSGGSVNLQIPQGDLACIGAWQGREAAIDLMAFVEEGKDGAVLRWNAPAGTWRVHALLTQSADTGADPFSVGVTVNALNSFDLSMADYDGPPARSRTFERTPAEIGDWSHDFFPFFEAKRGYDLREQLPAFFGETSGGIAERVRCDYRETLSDMYLASLEAWHQHTRNFSSLSRSILNSQPTHPIDLHTIADFPGSRYDPSNTLEQHFATSATRLSMKPLVSATIEPEVPFTPEQLVQASHELWLNGANHLILGGRTSTLDPATAALALDNTKGLWTNLEAFNSYATRIQSVLQHSAPDPDVLLYFPAHDFWTVSDGIPASSPERQEWLRTTGYQRAYDSLKSSGALFDSVSDSLLETAEVSGGNIFIGGLNYKGLILPEVRRLPETTALKLLDLASRGARIAFLGEWPEDVPGFPSPDIRRGTLIQTLRQLPRRSCIETNDLSEIIEFFGVQLESMALTGLRFTRRSHTKGHHYFIVNTTDQTFDDWVVLAKNAESAVILSPRFPQHCGKAELGQSDGTTHLRLRLEPGESRILRTFANHETKASPWRESRPLSEGRLLSGEWSIQIPGKKKVTTPILGSWLGLSDEGLESASVTYSLEFELDDALIATLDLGTVASTARVSINDQPLGTTFSKPHRFLSGRSLKKGTNKLEIEVTNTPDSALPPGLLGPVRLIPSESAD